MTTTHVVSTSAVSSPALVEAPPAAARRASLRTALAQLAAETGATVAPSNETRLAGYVATLETGRETLKNGKVRVLDIGRTARLVIKLCRAAGGAARVPAAVQSRFPWSAVSRTTLADIATAERMEPAAFMAALGVAPMAPPPSEALVTVPPSEPVDAPAAEDEPVDAPAANTPASAETQRLQAQRRRGGGRLGPGGKLPPPATCGGRWRAHVHGNPHPTQRSSHHADPRHPEHPRRHRQRAPHLPHRARGRRA